MKNNIRKEAGTRICTGFNGTEFNRELAELIEQMYICSFVLFRRNIESSEQLKELTSSIRTHVRKHLDIEPYIAVDQEGGDVRRLFFIDTPALKELGKGSESGVSSASSRTATGLAAHGINVNLAPVLDRIPPNGEHFLRTRSFGAHPEHTARLGSLWINLHQKHGIRCVAKHFPGLRFASVDPHENELTIVWPTPQDMWDDLYPFEAAIRSGVWGIMISHAHYPLWDSSLLSTPAFMSPVVCREWLQKRFSFRGVTFSDDLDMGAVKGRFFDEDIALKGTLAGIDCFLICNDIEHTKQMYETLVRLAEKDANFRNLQKESAIKLL